MSEVLGGDAAAAASAAADTAAEHAHVSIRRPTDLDEMSAAEELVEQIWEGAHLPINLQRAVSHAGSYLFAAMRGRQVVGVLIGFLGLRRGQLVLHSHVAGVQQGDQGRHVGFALKQHQRAWALARGVERVTWTFDPLVRRNAYFNLTKLAAAGVAYEPNYYGDMADGINGGQESDRLVIEWSLRDSRVASAAAGAPADVQAPALLREGAIPLLRVGPEGPSVTSAGHGDILLCQIPADIFDLRAKDPRAGDRWRSAVRSVVGGAITEGYEASAMSRDGWYVLVRRGAG